MNSPYLSHHPPAGERSRNFRRSWLLPFGTVLFLFLTACSKTHPITIVDIGKASRTQLGHQVGILSKYQPRILGLDFFLVPDSLSGDTAMVNALHRISNTIQVVGLHTYYEMFQAWDSLEVSHSKFTVSGIGFANLPSADSVILPDSPMSQRWHDSTIHSFGYAVALASTGTQARHRHESDSSIRLDAHTIGKNYNLITMDQVLSGSFNPDLVRDKIVLLGYLGDDDDFFYLDSLRTSRINGVEVHAAVISKLLSLRDRK